MSLGESFNFFEKLKLDKRDEKIAAQVLREIRSRLDFLIAVGLDLPLPGEGCSNTVRWRSSKN